MRVEPEPNDTTVWQFLGLSDEEVAFVDLKLALAQSLRSRRERKELTQNRLAELIESSQSRVAKMEAGDRTVSLDLLVRSLLAMDHLAAWSAGLVRPLDRGRS